MTEKTALITGASRGLGAALAEALAPEYHIIAVARTLGGLEELADRIEAKGGSSTLVPLDLTDDAGRQQMCKAIFDRWGALDLWAHTAIHASALTPAQDITAKDWEKSWKGNAEMVQRLIHMIAPLLGKTGTALFFDDAGAGDAYKGTYGATKLAGMTLAKAWQAETVNTGPRVIVETVPPMPTAVRARFYPGEEREALVGCSEVAEKLSATLQSAV
ncbi:SDR family NAD(P)-dependent oxidoreductase [Paracoccaceae bacterium GXU_MW_L88]